MTTRRDQVDAQRHVLTRLTGALVRGEPEAAESPVRRDRQGVMLGMIMAMVLLGGTAGWALLPGKGGSTAWRQPRKLIVDTTSGARYLLADGQLRAVLDLASARLVAGGGLEPVLVSGRQLAGLPRGQAVGSPDGPQSLPDAALVNQGAWRACSLGPASLLLAIGVRPVPGAPDDAALPVSSAGRAYLLWHGRRMRLSTPWAADVLGLGDVRAVEVSPRWLALLPPGPDVAPPQLPGDAAAGPRIAGLGSRIGQGYQAQLGDGSVRHYLMTGQGLAPLTPTEYMLDRGRPGAVPETSISAADLAAAPKRTPVRPLSGLPAVPPVPQAMEQGRSPCLETSGPGGALRMTPLAVPTADQPAGTGLVIRVRPGGGALLVPRLDQKVADQPGLLVDDHGTAYPVAGADVAALGYSTAQVAVAPAVLVGLLPGGPALTKERR